ncbi:MAG: hypothetical protein NC114_10625 [Ruminococcus flavefaciens]|nr:hypothetical protein [Ruminococcus flavefaciens]
MGVVPSATVFLAGPTDRHLWHTLWRSEFLSLVSKRPSFSQVMFVLPEFFHESELYPSFPSNVPHRYESVIGKRIPTLFPKSRIYAWERDNLSSSTAIVFWVDRSLEENRLALTTNIEFGNYHSDKCVCGAPSSSDRNDYLIYIWEQEQHRIWHTDMESLISELQSKLGLS